MCSLGEDDTLAESVKLLNPAGSVITWAHALCSNQQSIVLNSRGDLNIDGKCV